MIINKEHLLKIKALADRGVGGEAESAKRILARLLKESGVSESELKRGEKTEHYWRYKGPYEYKILLQLICKYGNNDSVRKQLRRNVLINECSEEDADWITVCFNLYRKDFKVVMDDALRAFIMANNIYPKQKDTRSFDDLSKEEQEAHKRAQRLADGINRTQLPQALIGDDE